MTTKAKRTTSNQQLIVSGARTNPSGGSAAAGGMNLHARVAAVAAVRLLGRQELGWLKGLEVDTPLEIWCETNGPGDDLRLVLANNLIVEAQIKKGLTRGNDLWITLESLANGIHRGAIDHGVLIVDIDASATIRSGLARGIVRLGEGRTDSLDEITKYFKDRLDSAGLKAQVICSKLRIVVMHCADHDDSSEQVAKTELLRLCASERDADSAWRAIQLSAHGLIERRGRWTSESLSSVLKTASVELLPTLGERKPIAISGGVWEHLDDISPYRGYIQAFRQHYLASGQLAAQPFGGRDVECERLDNWLVDIAAPNRYLITAPTARGKSALLVQWTERLVSDTTWAVVFVPISLRFSTDRPAVFYALLATQLACVMQTKLSPPSTDLDAYYQGVSVTLLNQAMKSGQHLLIVVDALDEAQGTEFNPTVFPRSLPPNIRILVSAREQVGDLGSEGWLKRLDWQGNLTAASERLSVLDRNAVIPIFESVGVAKAKVSDALITRLMVLSAGEPLLIALYAEDLSAIAKSGAQTSLESSLDGLLPGFNAYFSRAFDFQSSEWELQEAVDTTLAILAMALGPIEGPHLTNLVCSLCKLRRPTASDRFIKPLKRFIAGNGHADHGYVLNHPKLGEYLREERFDSTTRQSVEHAFIDWGRAVAKDIGSSPNIYPPTYVLRHHALHLYRAGISSLDDVELLLSQGWREAWFKVDRDYVGYAESLFTVSKIIRPCATYLEDGSRALRLRINIALLVGSVKSQSANVPSTLLAMALQEQLITLRQALNIVELQQPENRSDYLLTLAPNLPTAYLDQLLSDAHQTEDLGARNQKLARLAQHLSGQRRATIIDSVLCWLLSAGDGRPRTDIITMLAPALDNDQLDAVITDAMAKARVAPDKPSMVISLAPIIITLRELDKTELAEQIISECLRWMDTAFDPLRVVTALGMLSPLLDADRLKPLIVQLTPLVRALQAEHTGQSGAPNDFHSEVRREQVMGVVAVLAILQTQLLPAEDYKASLLADISPLSVPDFWKMDSLLNIVPMVRTETRQEVVSIAYQLALNLPSANNRTHALMQLASSALPPLQHAIIKDSFFNARVIEDDYSRFRTLISLCSTLPLAEKENELGGLLGSVMSVRYSLHLGELLLQMSSLLPALAGLVEVALRAISNVSDVGNSVSTMLREMEKIPASLKHSTFRQCWPRILTQPSPLSAYYLGMAARYAAEFWTTEEFEVACRTLKDCESHARVHVSVDLLPVAKLLGKHDFINGVLEEIALQEDPNTRLRHMAGTLESLPQDDSRRDLLRQYWFHAAALEEPQISTLIDSFELLDPEDQTIAWPMLVARAKTSQSPGQSLARLSLISKNCLERDDLIEEALVACASEKAESRIPQAAQIVMTCQSPAHRWRAFDLMTTMPDVQRATTLSALNIVAFALAETGSSALVKQVMDDVRQSAIWAP